MSALSGTHEHRLLNCPVCFAFRELELGREADRRRITDLENALANANLELGRTIVDYARPSIPWHDCEREGPDAGPDPDSCSVCAYAARGEALIADALSVLAEHTQGAG